MNNLKQITNFDILDAPSKTRVIMKAGELTSYPYRVIDISKLKGSTTKLGYCCEVKGIAYPIFLTFQGQGEAEFEIGKTGMFEFQDETWKNVNGDNEERIATVICTQVEVPDNIKFTLDYFYEI